MSSASPTPDDVLALPAGPELDDLAARLVMGWQDARDHDWQDREGRWRCTDGVNVHDQAFRPSREWQGAGELLDHLLDLGWHVSLVGHGMDEAVYRAFVIDPEGQQSRVECASGPLAITRAALLACLGQRERGQE